MKRNKLDIVQVEHLPCKEVWIVTRNVVKDMYCPECKSKNNFRVSKFEKEKSTKWK